MSRAQNFLFIAAAVCFNAYSFNAHADDASLYRRMGGKTVVDTVSAQTLHQVANDPAVNQSFKGVNLKKLEVKLADHICELTGGGCEYKGENMKVAHAGLKITEKEFYAMVEALRAALDNNGVGEREKNELLKILAPMKADVVTK
jgi:hemoglobin